MTQLQSVAWPAYSNDTGAGQDGTIGDAAFFNAMRDAINTLVHSTVNTAVTPKNIIDEVVTARGSLGALDTRLDVVLNEDGTLKTQASLVSATQAASFVGGGNCALNWDLASWANGGASAPDRFTLSGSGAAVARTGPAQADTFTFGAGKYAAKLTYGSAEAKLTQGVVATADMADYANLEGRTVSFGCRIKASVPNQASIIVNDGVTSTRGGSSGAGTYHVGDGVDRWCYGTHAVSASATQVSFYCSVATSGAAYFGGFVFLWSEVAPTNWIPFSALDYASATAPGRVSTGTQTFAGAKTFSDAVSVSGAFLNNSLTNAQFYNHPAFDPGHTGQPLASASGMLHAFINLTTLANNTTENTIFSHQLSPNTMPTTIRVTGGFRTGVSVGTLTFRFYFGSHVYSSAFVPSANREFTLQFLIVGNGANSQKIFFVPGGLITAVTDIDDAATETDASSIDIHFTGQKTTSTDDIVGVFFLVEVVG